MTFDDAIASITSRDELRGYIWGLKTFGGGAKLTKDQWATLARMKVDLERAEQERRPNVG